MFAATRDRVETAQEKRARQQKTKRADADFSKAHNAATSYGAALRSYAKQIARIVEHYAVGGIVPPDQQPQLNESLRAYAKGIEPWAARTTARMIAEVNRRNRTAWEQHTAGMSAELRKTLVETPLGPAVEGLLADQVDLITSLPLEAASRVHEATLAALMTSQRYPDATSQIEAALEAAHPDATAAWLKTRATLIARTETARTATMLTQARADSIGSTHYIWKTAGDWKVRASHKKLNNTVQAWSDPPLCDPPDYRAHPGSIWNCRCVAMPIVD